MSTYTYDDTLPGDLDRARAQLGVTDVTSAETALVSDEHINAVLQGAGSLPLAVTLLARELAATFAQKPSDVTLPSGLRLAWRDRISTWLTLAGMAQTSAAAASPAVSGLLAKTAPIAPPSPSGPDANDRAYRGDPYRRRWRP